MVGLEGGREEEGRGRGGGEGGSVRWRGGGEAGGVIVEGGGEPVARQEPGLVLLGLRLTGLK